MALGPVLLLYGFYTAFMVYTGKEKGTIHLVVLHAVALNNFSPLTLDISQSQSSEFIQVPKGLGMESIITSLTQRIQPGSNPKRREVWIPLQKDSAVAKSQEAPSLRQQNLSPAFWTKISILPGEEQHCEPHSWPCWCWSPLYVRKV